MHKYRLVAKKGEGTFSEVLKAQFIKNGKYVAIKCMKNHFDSLDQVNNLREIQALRRLSPHPNIIKLIEVLYDQPTGRLALVFELMDMNIYELIRGRRHYVAEDRVKSYMYQLMKAMDHMHRNGIFHRDIKPENILIMDDCLKLADFGSCRGVYSKQPYTEYISTRWYRAPECLLTDGYYNYKMDMWGVGCVFFEIVSLFPLFPGNNELDQIQKIHNIMGTPPPEMMAKLKKRSQHMNFDFPTKEGTGIAKLIPHVSPECVELISKLLAYSPEERISARQALKHPYFREIREAEKRQKAMIAPDVSGHFMAMEEMKVAMERQASQSTLGEPSIQGHQGPAHPEPTGPPPDSSRSHWGPDVSSNNLPSITGRGPPGHGGGGGVGDVVHHGTALGHSFSRHTASAGGGMLSTESSLMALGHAGLTVQNSAATLDDVYEDSSTTLPPLATKSTARKHSQQVPYNLSKANGNGPPSKYTGSHSMTNKYKGGSSQTIGPPHPGSTKTKGTAGNSINNYKSSGYDRAAYAHRAIQQSLQGIPLEQAVRS